MEGDKRRETIIALLKKSEKPLSGTELARQAGVSRQVIVQDIALLRAVNKNILSTNKGYLLYDPEETASMSKTSFRVNHTDEQMRDELYTIVDCGGKVLDVVVEHSVYGQITVDLILKNRMDVDEFLNKLETSKDQPLKALTRGSHYHTVEAENEKILETIEKALREKGYLA